MSARSRLIDAIRFEDGAWPLWRWDRNVRYIAKSLLHVRRAPADEAHFAEVHDYLRASGLARDRRAAATLSAVGDVMWIRSGYARSISPGLRATLARADLNIANLETPIDPTRPAPRLVYETLHYNAPPSYLEAWRGAAPRRVFSLCNNHALDQGAGGLARTRAAVLADPASTCVGGPSAGDEAAGVELPNDRSLRIGLCAFTYGINHLRGPAPAGVPVLHLGSRVHAPDWPRLRALIASARARGPDLVVALPHWGFEYEHWPDARGREDAHQLIALGVDIVLGSSPHVLQPVEPVSIDGADPRCPVQVARGGPPRMGVIAYSLGNFLSIMPTLPCRTGVVLEIGLDPGPGGVFSVTHLAATPTFCGRRVGGGGLLDAGVVALDELPAASPAAEARAHARAILGPDLIP